MDSSRPIGHHRQEEKHVQAEPGGVHRGGEGESFTDWCPWGSAEDTLVSRFTSRHPCYLTSNMTTCSIALFAEWRDMKRLAIVSPSETPCVSVSVYGDNAEDEVVGIAVADEDQSSQYPDLSSQYPDL